MFLLCKTNIWSVSSTGNVQPCSLIVISIIFLRWKIMFGNIKVFKDFAQQKSAFLRISVLNPLQATFSNNQIHDHGISNLLERGWTYVSKVLWICKNNKAKTWLLSSMCCITKCWNIIFLKVCGQWCGCQTCHQGLKKFSSSMILILLRKTSPMSPIFSIQGNWNSEAHENSSLT